MAAAPPPHAYGFGRETAPETDTVTLTAGTSFLICRADGSISSGGVQGYYVADTRVLSTLLLTIDGEHPRVLAVHRAPTALHVVGSVGEAINPHLLVEQFLELGAELSLTITVENLTAVDRSVQIELTVHSDFADLFDVKRGSAPRGGMVTYGALDEDLIFRYQNAGFRRGVRIHVDEPDVVLRDGIVVVEPLTPHGVATVTALASPVLSHGHRSIDSGHLRRRWLATAPGHDGEHVPARVWNRSWDDLGALLMRDPLDGRRMIIAAGSPWFMALFGRDSLMASWQTLPYRSDLALDVLEALAARQGRRYDRATLEEPGRIPHETRRGEAVERADGWGTTYYGTTDATPLFVMTLHRAWQLGADHERVAALVPAAVAAVEWMTHDGDPDGDGFVEYPGVVTGRAGLANQGWKDSHDAIRHADGTLADGPIALVEVQAYCHAAFLALADLHEAFGTGDPQPLRERAARLHDAIEERFWMDDEDCYALALDGAKRQVAGVSSNAGHLLFTGTATGDHAQRLCRRLMADDMFTGFGVRTLSSDNPAYNPLSYHCGSVWPHDTAVVAAGMLRVDRTAGARLATSLMDAADGVGRLPELFGGFSRDAHDRPIPYPTSCSPQAWAAGAPLLLAAVLDGREPADRARLPS